MRTSCTRSASGHTNASADPAGPGRPAVLSVKKVLAGRGAVDYYLMSLPPAGRDLASPLEPRARSTSAGRSPASGRRRRRSVRPLADVRRRARPRPWRAKGRYGSAGPRAVGPGTEVDLGHEPLAPLHQRAGPLTCSAPSLARCHRCHSSSGSARTTVGTDPTA